MLRGERGEGGGINFVKIFMVAAVVSVVYLAWVFVPIYVDDYTIITAMHTAANSAYARRTENEVDRMLMNGFARANLQNESFAADGSVIKRPVDYSSDNWTITLLDEPPQVTIDLTYDREIVFPILKKERVLHFHHVIIEDLSRIDF